MCKGEQCNNVILNIGATNKITTAHKTALLVNNTNITFEIDTGSPVTIVPKAIATQFKGKLEDFGTTLKSCSGHTLPVLGTLKVHVKYKGRNFYVQTVVVDVEITPLLGRDWLNVINPAWKNQVLHVTEDKLTLE